MRMPKNLSEWKELLFVVFPGIFGGWIVTCFVNALLYGDPGEISWWLKSLVIYAPMITLCVFSIRAQIADRVNLGKSLFILLVIFLLRNNVMFWVCGDMSFTGIGELSDHFGVYETSTVFIHMVIYLLPILMILFACFNGDKAFRWTASFMMWLYGVMYIVTVLLEDEFFFDGFLLMIMEIMAFALLRQFNQTSYEKHVFSGNDIMKKVLTLSDTDYEIGICYLTDPDDDYFSDEMVVCFGLMENTFNKALLDAMTEENEKVLTACHEIRAIGSRVFFDNKDKLLTKDFVREQFSVLHAFVKEMSDSDNYMTTDKDYLLSQLENVLNSNDTDFWRYATFVSAVMWGNCTKTIYHAVMDAEMPCVEESTGDGAEIDEALSEE